MTLFLSFKPPFNDNFNCIPVAINYQWIERNTELNKENIGHDIEIVHKERFNVRKQTIFHNLETQDRNCISKSTNTKMGIEKRTKNFENKSEWRKWAQRIHRRLKKFKSAFICEISLIWKTHPKRTKIRLLPSRRDFCFDAKVLFQSNKAIIGIKLTKLKPNQS